jgi:hypothetical protein
MATVQLDKDYAVDLLEGEVVVYAHKVAYFKGFLKTPSYYFVITNKRIALMPKKSNVAENISYADIYRAKCGKIAQDNSFGQFHIVLNEKKNLLGFIPVRKSIKFHVKGSFAESVKLLGKHFAEEGKYYVSTMLDIADYQQRVQSIDRRGDLSDQQKQWAKNEAWSQTSKEWGTMFEKTAIADKKPNPAQRMKLIVELVNDALEVK